MPTAADSEEKRLLPNGTVALTCKTNAPKGPAEVTYVLFGSTDAMKADLTRLAEGAKLTRASSADTVCGTSRTATPGTPGMTVTPGTPSPAAAATTPSPDTTGMTAAPSPGVTGPTPTTTVTGTASPTMTTSPGMGRPGEGLSGQIAPRVVNDKPVGSVACLTSDNDVTLLWTDERFNVATLATAPKEQTAQLVDWWKSGDADPVS